MEGLQLVEVINNVLDSRAEKKSLSSLLHYLHATLYKNLKNSDTVVSDLIDSEFLNEILHLNDHEHIFLYFGKSLRCLKIVFRTGGSIRDIDVLIQYKGLKRICVTDANLPPSPLLSKEYSSLTDIVTNFLEHIDSLTPYFHELDRIDRFCTVMEPAKPTFRDAYRRILLDERAWLHVKVSPKGFATDIHLVGNAEQWSEKLQLGLLNWDHDMDIVENITAVFDIWNFPTEQKLPEEPKSLEKVNSASDEIVCNICFSSEQLESPSVPQPLCKNAKCVAYFHRNCLFQWLLACSGGRLPAFGVTTGTCPACYESTTCSVSDN
ncbi:E3 ubiquitin-protein ligase Fancl [Choristoneura fumiferana]|uniref:E3 ubiquitin-protein ligase Fancl n=1 Tax=Choristoneura fumiferana TaxID=7141 RepID=UPI003D15CD7F